MSKLFTIIFLLLLLTCNLIYSNTAVDYYNQANRDFFLEEYNEAIDNLMRAIEINPNYIDAILLLAKIHYLNNNFDYAFNYANRAMRLSSTSRDVILFVAAIEIKLQRYSDAEAKYRQVLQNDPLNAEAQNGLSEIYLLTGNAIMARRTLEQILNRDSTNFTANLLMAKYYEDINSAQAIQYYENNIRLNSLNPDSFYTYSVYLYKIGEFQKAYIHINTAMQISNKPNYKNFYAKLLLSLNRPDQSVEIFRSLLGNDNDNLVFYHLSFGYLMKGDFEQAISSLNRSLLLRSDDEIAARFYDSLLIEHLNGSDNRRISRSLQHYRTAMENKRGSNLDLYIFYLKESLRINPRNVESRIELANYYLSKNFPERYIRELSIVKQYTNDRSILDRIEIESSRISYRLGDDWELNQYQVPVMQYKIPLFINVNIENQHYKIESIAAYLLQRISYDKQNFVIEVYDDSTYNRAQKRNIALSLKSPFYFIFSADDNNRLTTLSLSSYNSNNNELIKNYRAVRQGNNRLVLSATSLSDQIADDIPFRARIIGIKDNRALINAGRYSGLRLRDRFIVLSNREYQIEFARGKYIYNDNDVKGSGLLIKLDENIAEIRLNERGFFREINIDDIIIFE